MTRRTQAFVARLFLASIPVQHFAARQHRTAAQLRRPRPGSPEQVLLDGGYCLDSLIESPAAQGRVCPSTAA